MKIIVAYNKWRFWKRRLSIQISLFIILFFDTSHIPGVDGVLLERFFGRNSTIRQQSSDATSSNNDHKTNSNRTASNNTASSSYNYHDNDDPIQPSPSPSKSSMHKPLIRKITTTNSFHNPKINDIVTKTTKAKQKAGTLNYNNDETASAINHDFIERLKETEKEEKDEDNSESMTTLSTSRTTTTTTISSSSNTGNNSKGDETISNVSKAYFWIAVASTTCVIALSLYISTTNSMITPSFLLPSIFSLIPTKTIGTSTLTSTTAATATTNSIVETMINSSSDQTILSLSSTIFAMLPWTLLLNVVKNQQKLLHQVGQHMSMLIVDIMTIIHIISYQLPPQITIYLQKTAYPFLRKSIEKMILMEIWRRFWIYTGKQINYLWKNSSSSSVGSSSSSSKNSNDSGISTTTTDSCSGSRSANNSTDTTTRNHHQNYLPLNFWKENDHITLIPKILFDSCEFIHESFKRYSKSFVKKLFQTSVESMIESIVRDGFQMISSIISSMFF